MKTTNVTNHLETEMKADAINLGPMTLMKTGRMAWLAVFVGLAFTCRTQAPQPEVLFSFPGKLGIRPIGTLAQGIDGHFYGVTQMGGANDGGTVFRVSTSAVVTRLVSFDGDTNGAFPGAGLVRGLDGNLYGTTGGGGSTGYGTVFKMTLAGILTTLATFDGTNGIGPGAPLMQDSDGNFYGTTQGGGSVGAGTVFKVTTNGAVTVLASFNNSFRGPYSGVTLGRDGNFHGTTQYGGSSDAGTVFKVTTNGVLTNLVSVLPEFPGDF